MVVAPCSVRTLAAIASGQGDNLIHRAADVIMKERRKLVLLVRETPLNEIHLENMLKLARMGVVILPPMPAFYNHPPSIDALVDHLVMRTLDQFDIHTDLATRWGNEMQMPANRDR
jgi:4-hydroxy-3-polyprenylbenzoate decarboxylase